MTTTMTTTPKIIDLINDIKKNKDAAPRISLEYFPPRTDEGVQNLYKRMDRMLTTTAPLFTDITWGAGGSTADVSLQLALYAQSTGHVANLHLTCTNMTSSATNTPQTPSEYMLEQLNAAKEGGIRNIVALRGDPPAGQTEWKATDDGTFTCALDLVTFIRANYQDYFGISVAGYPEGHPNAITKIEDPSTLTPTEQARASVFDNVTYVCKDEDYAKEIEYLKKKVDAGADFIISQMFFDVHVFLTFVDDCRKGGITCPILPGIMCIHAYSGLSKMSFFCKTRIPLDLQQTLERIRDDDDAVKQFGMEFTTQMIQILLQHQKEEEHSVQLLHFYTLNLEKVVYGIMEMLNLRTNTSTDHVE